VLNQRRCQLSNFNTGGGRLPPESVARIERNIQYVVFRPELSSWGLDLSFFGLIRQGLFSSSNSRDSKDIYVIMAVPVSLCNCHLPWYRYLIGWIKGPALYKHSFALAEIDAVDFQSLAPVMPMAITKPQK